MTSAKPPREPPISYRPPGGAPALRTLARAEGLSVSALLTLRVFGVAPVRKRRLTSTEERVAAVLLGEVARICDHLANAIEAAPDQSCRDVLERCQAEHLELRAWIMDALGRSP